MKTSLAFLYDNKSGNIQYINKKQFISNTITKLSRDQKKVFSLDEVKKTNNFTYKDIIQEFDTSFKKLEKGIYSLKLNQSKIILICLLDKTTKDFEKYCKKNNLKFGQEVDKIELKNDKKVVIDKLTPINNKKDIKIDNSIIEKWRKTKMNKNNLNKVIKKGAIVIAASLATMSLFGCNSKVEGNKTYTTYPIDQDEQISNGDKIVTKEDKTNLGNEIQQNITISPEEAARGKTIENTKRTVNEYGITIYGKEIGEQNAINKGLVNELRVEKDRKNGWIRTYTEYYSDAYGGKVYLAINAKTGGLEIFNEKGERFLAGDKPQNDIEVGLANYRMGNAMAEAIDRTYKK